jgi:hypothetical protein
MKYFVTYSIEAKSKEEAALLLRGNEKINSILSDCEFIEKYKKDTSIEKLVFIINHRHIRKIDINKEGFIVTKSAEFEPQDTDKMIAYTTRIIFKNTKLSKFINNLYKLLKIHDNGQKGSQNNRFIA